MQDEQERLSLEMNEVRKEIANKYNVFIERELSLLEAEMESRLLKYVSALNKVQTKIYA